MDLPLEILMWDIKVLAFTVQILLERLKFQTVLKNDRMTDKTKTICPPIFDIGGTKTLFYTNKRVMGYIAHLRYQFKWKITFEHHNIDKAINNPIVNNGKVYLIFRNFLHLGMAWSFTWTNLNFFPPRMFCVKLEPHSSKDALCQFGWNWLSAQINSLLNNFILRNKLDHN